jgi:hypothetical protein
VLADSNASVMSILAWLIALSAAERLGQPGPICCMRCGAVRVHCKQDWPRMHARQPPPIDCIRGANTSGCC